MEHGVDGCKEGAQPQCLVRGQPPPVENCEILHVNLYILVFLLFVCFFLGGWQEKDTLAQMWSLRCSPSNGEGQATPPLLKNSIPTVGHFMLPR